MRIRSVILSMVFLILSIFIFMVLGIIFENRGKFTVVRPQSENGFSNSKDVGAIMKLQAERKE